MLQRRGLRFFDGMRIYPLIGTLRIGEDKRIFYVGDYRQEWSSNWDDYDQKS